MSDAANLVATVLAILTSTTVLIGLAARFVLLPWLRENLIKPVEETRHQVTVNAHASPQPTVLDRLDEISTLFSDHIENSTREHADLWDALNNRKEPNQ